MTLVALLALTTQAWAVDDLTNKIWKPGDTFNIGAAWLYDADTSTATVFHSINEDNTVPAINDWTYDSNSNQWKTPGFIKVDKVDFDGDVISLDYSILLALSAPEGKLSADVKPIGFKIISGAGTKESPYTLGLVYEEAPASAVEVEWDAATKTGTFAMPASNVVLTPIYAKTAAFATTGTEPEVKTLLPEAAEGVIAGTDASLIAEGTGIVAFAGTAIGTSATEAPALTAFSATVPTAEDVADDGGNVYVWYYIQGADAPDGQEATEENTFNNSAICATPLTVQVLTNKFDITFNAANANTIEAGKATVTVGGTAATVTETAATVTEGKLEGVKMGSEVKMTAKPGYKFRKVEVKKKAAAPSLNITNPVVGQVIGSDGKNYAYGSLPTGVTAVAKICYVSGSNGLALALTDEGVMDWSTAMTTCAAHTPAFTGGTWKLATKDEWNNMISAAGSDDNDLLDGFSSVGGTNMESGSYCSSTEDGSDSAWVYLFFESMGWSSNEKDFYFCVRACLAF